MDPKRMIIFDKICPVFDRFLLFGRHFIGDKEPLKTIGSGMPQKQSRGPVPPLLAGLTLQKSALRITGQAQRLRKRAVSDWRIEKALFEQKSGKLEL